ncbi:hypothetical protein LCGC14_1806470, partial [marine sediment metagenome]
MTGADSIEMSDNVFEKLKKEFEKQEKTDVCPHCGRCPHCG